MKKLILITIIISLAFTPLVFAALDATIEWDVRTTGNDANGGGYDLTSDGGVDYSQQDAAQLTATDLVCAGGTAVVTSAGAGFTANMVDNIMYISDTGDSAHFVIGYYQIVTYTSTSQVTLDRDPTDTTADAGGDFKVGGAILTISQAVDNAAADGHKIYVESGTYDEYVNASDDDVSTNGLYILLEGFKDSHGDAPTGTDRPLIDAESTRTICLYPGDGWVTRHFRCANATNGGIRNDDGVMFVNVKVSGSSWQGFRDGGYTAIGCESTLNSGGSNSSGYHYFCYHHDNTNSGFGQSTNGGHQVIGIGCVSDSNTNQGFKFGRHSIFINSVAYNNTGASGDGFMQVADGTPDPRIVITNCIANDNGRYGFNKQNTAYQFGYFDYNNYEGNSTDGLNLYIAGGNDSAADPDMPNKGTGDFTLNTGSPMIDAGLQPSTDSGLTGDYKWNIGADQDDVAAGGATTDVFGWVD